MRRNICFSVSIVHYFYGACNSNSPRWWSSIRSQHNDDVRHIKMKIQLFDEFIAYGLAPCILLLDNSSYIKAENTWFFISSRIFRCVMENREACIVDVQEADAHKNSRCIDCTGKWQRIDVKHYWNIRYLLVALIPMCHDICTNFS